MQQNILLIKNIKFIDDVRIQKPEDISDTYIYEDLQRLYPTLEESEIIKRSHVGYFLANLFAYNNFNFEYETITPNDVRYQEATDIISSYTETEWFMDDAYHIELSDDYYEFEYEPTLYMYFDDWIQYGYEMLLDADKYKQALQMIVYEYARRFLIVKLK